MTHFTLSNEDTVAQMLLEDPMWFVVEVGPYEVAGNKVRKVSVTVECCMAEPTSLAVGIHPPYVVTPLAIHYYLLTVLEVASPYLVLYPGKQRSMHIL